MSEDEIAEDDTTDLFDSVVSFEVSGRPPREYDGWHLPRKQAIRQSQWAAPLLSLLNDRKTETPVVKYLGLPGRDLLDVHEILTVVCERHDRQVQFIGFDRTAQAGIAGNSLLNSSYADLMRLPSVSDRSVVSPDDIMLLARTDSQAFALARSEAPFDIINLDFCEPVIGRSASVFPLLHRIFNMQRSTSDWLLTLTSRVAASIFDSDLLNKLEALLNQNLTDCTGFEELLRENLHVHTEGLPLSLRSVPETDVAAYSAILLGKWLVKEAISARLKLHVVSVCGYRVHQAPAMDMLSLSMRVSPAYETSGDAAGLVKADPLDECDEARRVTRVMAAVEDLDDYMNDPARRRRYAKESLELIRRANHPEEPYRKFLEEAGFGEELSRLGA